jgi:hypothetical protein
VKSIDCTMIRAATTSLLAAPRASNPGVDTLYEAAGIGFRALHRCAVSKAIAGAPRSRAVAR